MIKQTKELCIDGHRCIDCDDCPEEQQKPLSKMPFQMTNHEIGCILESYVEILEYRNFQKLAKQLEEIASNLK